ncbi:prepilin-type cleavage/methylation domain-containing protein [Tamilnaduibacter salinus]|uniref:Prepilin-type cleavage/methylation domain-containing protein n=2 Tax=Tamilnaduibacter salinus TaxID=1484056 RepID=A0A2A2I4J2_9GAMM|nr:prepilin-type cleavage/methylation domain-containing protein [Tamilnaduibacter salinus]
MKPSRPAPHPLNGFSLVELVVTIVLLAILAAFVLPRFADLRSQSRQSTIDAIEGSMRSTITIVKSKARASGLSPSDSNPSGSNGSDQSGYLVKTEAGESEVDWRNLCPESRAELADTLTMLDHISVDPNAANLKTAVGNQFTRVGFNLSSQPAQACYVEYDSFGEPDCTVTTVTTGC